jgi:hypothetical protein
MSVSMAAKSPGSAISVRNCASTRAEGCQRLQGAHGAHGARGSGLEWLQSTMRAKSTPMVTTVVIMPLSAHAQGIISLQLVTGS